MNEKDLAQSNYLFAIDDSVYNLENFDHPGGKDIFIFGGRDVTPHYRSLHAFHSKDHYKKVLEKYYVGKYLPNSNANSKENFVGCSDDYTFDTDFAIELRNEVKKIMAGKSSFADFGWYFRSVFYFVFWLIGTVGYLLYADLTWSIIYGVSRALLSLNLGHDANHGSVSKSERVNELLGFSLDLVGVSRYIWIQQHGVYHHGYCEHVKCDPDSGAGKGIFYLKDTKKGLMGKYTHLFFEIPVSIYGFDKLLNTVQFTLKYPFSPVKMNWKGNEKLISSAIHIAVVLIDIHIFWRYSFFKALGLLYISYAMASLILGNLFLMSHNFEGMKTTFEKKGKVDWYKQQIESSCSYGGVISGWLTGGLNYQIEHHIFPRLNSSHYPLISEKVKEICTKHGVKYTYFPSVFHNFASMVRYLKNQS